MLIPRLIPCLLLKNAGLVKTLRFRGSPYVGDPINAIRIFNDKQVDELIVLDIEASRLKRTPDFEMISTFADECFMPLAYGGGVDSADAARRLFDLGIEKVIVNTAARRAPGLVHELASVHGSQSVVVSIDVKKSFLGRYEVFDHVSATTSAVDPVVFSKRMQEEGAGEIFLNSVDRDGTMAGYDLDLIRTVCRGLRIPVIACGGAGGVDDCALAIREGAAAAAAGSMFVFQGKHRAVLISYPDGEALAAMVRKAGV